MVREGEWEGCCLLLLETASFLLHMLLGGFTIFLLFLFLFPAKGTTEVLVLQE